MKDKISILKEIDAAIDAMDEDGINAGLRALSALEPRPIRAEDAKAFAARVQKLNKERNSVKKPQKSIRAAAIVAAAVMLMGLSAYAAGALNLFSFQQGGRFVTFRTTETMSEQEARAHVGEDTGDPVPEGAASQPDTRDFTFETVEQAEAELDMKIPIPAAMPEMRLESANGVEAAFGENMRKRTVWLNYADERGRMFGVTVARELLKPGSQVTSYTTNDIDDGSLGRYKSASGVEFTTLAESDDAGTMTAHIAVAMVGEYEYALVFVGFDEAGRQAVIDSVDLSVYE